MRYAGSGSAPGFAAIAMVLASVVSRSSRSRGGYLVRWLVPGLGRDHAAVGRDTRAHALLLVVLYLYLYLYLYLGRYLLLHRPLRRRYM